jgi:hypothetical protein
VARATQFSDRLLLCRKLLINTRLQPGAKGEAEKNRLNGFSRARSWFTALKRGVNEMISTEHLSIKSFCLGIIASCPFIKAFCLGIIASCPFIKAFCLGIIASYPFIKAFCRKIIAGSGGLLGL